MSGELAAELSQRDVDAIARRTADLVMHRLRGRQTVEEACERKLRRALLEQRAIREPVSAARPG